MGKKRVYVSSTYEDLKRHRDAVVRELRGLYDVECMEDYPAADDRPTNKCLKDVEACDYFILILGLRYGYVPEEENPLGKSITHLEYDHAILNKKPCFIFLLHPRHRQKAKWVDARAHDSTSKIGAFRRDVDTNHVRALFTTPLTLVSQVHRALNQYEQTHADRRPAFRWPAAWEFTAFMEERREGFHGRDWLFEDVRQWLGETHPRALLIKADLGVGKSAFLSQLVCTNPGKSVVAWHFCQHDTKETLKPATFVRSLATRLADALPDYRRIVEEDPGIQERLALDDASSVFEALILNPLRRVPVPSSHRLLVVDALDEALEVDQEPGARTESILSLLAAKASRLPDWLRILATSRKNPTVVDRLRAAFGLREIDAEDDSNQRDLHEYVLARCASQPISGRLSASASSPAAIATLIRDRSEGKFLYAVRALNDLANGVISVKELTELQPGMDAFYAMAFERRFGDAGDSYTPFKELLGVLALAREPLPSSTLAAILGRREDEIDTGRRQLSDFIAVRKGGYALDHFSLTEWLTTGDAGGGLRAGAWAIDVPAARETLRAWAISRIDAGDAHREPYLLRHAGAHLTGSERERVFASLLFDPRWLYGRLRAAGAAALVEDCGYVQHSDAVRLLRLALRNSAHVLATEPRLLPGQLIARLGAQDRPELQALCRAVQESHGEWGPALLPVTASLPLSAALIATLRGNYLVTALAVLSDGRLAVGSRHGPVRVWSPGRGSDALVLQGCQYGVTSLAPLPRGGLAAGTERGIVYVWERPGDGEAVPLARHDWNREIHHLVLLRDGRLASASGDRAVIWDPAARAEPIVLRGGEYGVSTVVELSDGRIASGSNEGTIRVWNVAGGVDSLVLQGHRDLVQHLVALPGGCLVSAGSDKTIRVWDCTNGAQSFQLIGHEGQVGALAALPDGRIASSSNDGRIRVWTPTPGGLPVILEGHSELPRSGTVRALVSLPDGRLASGADDGTVRVWDPAGAGHYVLHEHKGLITRLAVLPDGTLASGAGDGSVRVLDAEIRAGVPSASERKGAVLSLAVLPDGRIAFGAEDCSVRVRHVTTGVDTVRWRGGKHTVDSIRVLPDGGVACATSGEVVILQDPGRRSRPRVVWKSESDEADVNIVGRLAAFPDGRLAAAVSRHSVRVWDPGRREEGRILSGHEDWIWDLAALRDGRLATACDTIVRVWNLERSDEPLVLPHDGVVFHLAVLSDGRLASGASDGTVRVFDLARGSPAIALMGHEQLVSGLAALPGGRLASASADRTVRLWDVDGRREIARFHADAGLLALAATSDGLVLAGDNMGRIHSLRLVE